jgi:hypothetical protein
VPASAADRAAAFAAGIPWIDGGFRLGVLLMSL